LGRRIYLKAITAVVGKPSSLHPEVSAGYVAARATGRRQNLGITKDNISIIVNKPSSKVILSS
jgi:hypothetical protein